MRSDPTYLVEWPVVEAGLRDVLEYLRKNGAGLKMSTDVVIAQVEHAVRQRQQGHQQREGAHEWLPSD